MALTQVTGPYPIFTDLDGSPLDDGYLYIGAINDDPEQNPIQVFLDANLTIPATQPIRTSNGYAYRNGTPALLFTGGEFSITIRNKRNEFVLYSPVGYGFDPAAVSASVVKNDFTGDGVTVAFVLSASPSTVLATNIFINGVYQEKNSYTLSGNTITFTVAPPLSSSIEIMTNETGVINSGNANDITYTLTASGAVQQTVQTKLEQYVSVADFGAVGDGTTDDTVAIQAALDSGAASVELTGKVYAVDGTLTIPAGVTLIGQTVASEYFPGGPGSTTVGSCLHKLSTGTNGPLVILQSSSGISNLYLKHSKVGGATTGIVQVGVAGATDVYNSSITNVTIYGVPTTDLTGATTCYGIFYPDGSVSATDQRYFNRASNFYITNTDVGIRLGENCNGNTFSSFVTRQIYQHILLDGIVGGCVENVFSGFVCANIGVLPTSPTTVFTLLNYSLFNTFTGYTTECNGTAFSIDATSSNNSFFGNENEIALSVVPPNNTHSLWTQPANRSQQSQMLIPTVAAPQNYTGGAGNLVRFTRAISGTLPTLNSSTFTAADPSSKVIARFNPTVYSKSVKPGFRARLTLALNAPGGSVGESIVEVEFFYRVTDNSTQAAELSVISVVEKPATNYITGLKFLTGVASGLGFGLAVVGGNVGPVAATHIIADLEILAFTFSVNSVAVADYADVTWASIPATANDVTDAIDLLTVADTAI
jgi:hypothetical protein